MTKKNVSEEEVLKFERLASSWWDPNGSNKALHQYNHFRIDYIQKYSDGLLEKKVLDIGCGGGLLSESMSALSADVMAIDMSKEAIHVAKAHAQEMGLNIQYILDTTENISEQYVEYFDVITCMEMLEHVPEPQSIIQHASTMLKKGGVLCLSTINRNMFSYLFTIVAAEYIMKIIPKGTHEYNKYIKPSELISWCESSLLTVEDLIGVKYNPFFNSFKETHSLNMNYMLFVKKK